MYLLQLISITNIFINIWVLLLRINGSDTWRLHLGLDVPFGDWAVFYQWAKAVRAVRVVRTHIIRLRLIIELTNSQCTSSYVEGSLFLWSEYAPLMLLIIATALEPGHPEASTKHLLVALFPHGKLVVRGRVVGLWALFRGLPWVFAVTRSIL